LKDIIRTGSFRMASACAGVIKTTSKSTRSDLCMVTVSARLKLAVKSIDQVGGIQSCFGWRIGRTGCIFSGNYV
jgi:rRNA maturation endonuclease Nob1